MNSLFSGWGGGGGGVGNSWEFLVGGGRPFLQALAFDVSREPQESQTHSDKTVKQKVNENNFSLQYYKPLQL